MIIMEKSCNNKISLFQKAFQINPQSGAQPQITFYAKFKRFFQSNLSWRWGAKCKFKALDTYPRVVEQSSSTSMAAAHFRGLSHLGILVYLTVLVPLVQEHAAKVLAQTAKWCLSSHLAAAAAPTAFARF